MNDEREQRILDAAETLVLHYGYDKTTISDIAQVAKVAKGTVYLHWKSKEDLFEALFWREIWKYTDDMLTRLQALPVEEWSFISMYEQAMFALSGSALMQAMMRDDTRVLGNFMHKRGDKFLKMKQPMRIELLALMQKAGAIRQDVDIEAANHLISAMSYGMLNMHVIVQPEEAPTLENLIPTMSQMLQRWLVPEDGGNREAARQIIMQMIAAFKTQYQGKEIDDGHSNT